MSREGGQAVRVGVAQCADSKLPDINNKIDWRRNEGGGGAQEQAATENILSSSSPSHYEPPEPLDWRSEEKPSKRHEEDEWTRPLDIQVRCSKFGERLTRAALAGPISSSEARSALDMQKLSRRRSHQARETWPIVGVACGHSNKLRHHDERADEPLGHC